VSGREPTYAEQFGLGRWQTCPVCFGKGMVPNGFYSSPGVLTWPATSTTPEQCRSCGGNGIVK
jgi:DnaJ-class molecular chaperone